MVYSEMTGSQYDKVIEILTQSPDLYCRNNVIKMLNSPNNLVMDDEGRMCLWYVHDADRLLKREMWMMFASPVAMAVHLRKFNIAKKLVDLGYPFDPLEHFLAFNIEGELARRIICDRYGHMRPGNTDYCIFKYNDLTNLELMTCMVSSPKWIVEGVWNELSNIKGELSVFDSVIDNMNYYYNYSDMLADKVIRSIDVREDILQCYTACIQRLNCQLIRMLSGNYPNLNVNGLSGEITCKEDYYL